MDPELFSPDPDPAFQVGNPDPTLKRRPLVQIQTLPAFQVIPDPTLNTRPLIQVQVINKFKVFTVGLQKEF